MPNFVDETGKTAKWVHHTRSRVRPRRTPGSSGRDRGREIK